MIGPSFKEYVKSDVDYEERGVPGGLPLVIYKTHGVGNEDVGDEERGGGSPPGTTKTLKVGSEDVSDNERGVPGGLPLVICNISLSMFFSSYSMDL